MKETVSGCFFVFFLKTAYNKFVLRPDLHPGTLTFSLERQSARMSKITNDGLTRSGTGRFIVVVPKWQQCASKSYSCYFVLRFEVYPGRQLTGVWRG